MAADPVEIPFERWRREHDLEALATVFDALAPDLLRVASHLVGDATTAEDLVQLTFLAVLRAPQRFRAGERLLPWLIGILTRQAGTHRRRARRQIDPQRLRGIHEESPEQHAAAAEASAAVRSAVQRLAEPYAAVVQACLFEGARPAELAARRACTPGAVRMQLSRGLAMLRRVLPPGLAVPFVVQRAEAACRVRDLVLDAAARLPSVALTAPVFPLLLMKKLLLPAVTGLVLFCATWVWLSAPPASREPAVAVLATPAAAASGNGAVGASTSSSASAPSHDAANARSAAAAAPAPGLWLVGRVRCGAEPAGAASVAAHAWGQNVVLRGAVEPDGTYALDASALALAASSRPMGDAVDPADGSLRLHVAVEHASCLPKAILLRIPRVVQAPGERREVRQDFELDPAAIVFGRVICGAGDFVAHTKIGLFPRVTPPTRVAQPLAVGQPDAEGRFEIKLDRGGDLEAWVTNPRRRPVLVPVQTAVGTRSDLGTIRLDAIAASVRGCVAQGAPRHENVLVAARRALPNGAEVLSTTFEFLTRVDGVLVDTVREAWTDSRGVFELAGLEAGPWLLRVESVPTWPLVPQPADVAVEAPAVGVTLLGDYVPMHLRIEGPEGAIEGAEVHIVVGDASSTSTSGADGLVQWLGRRDLSYRLAASHERFESSEADLPGEHLAGGAAVLAMRALPTATLELTVVDEGGHGAPCLRVQLLTADGQPLPRAVERQAEWRGQPLRFPGLPSGVFRLQVQPEDRFGLPFGIAGTPTAVVEVEVCLRAGATTSTRVVRRAVGRLVIAAALGLPADAGPVALEVRNAAGVAVATRTIMDRADGWYETKGRLDANGRNTLQPDLPPGDYTVVVSHAALGALRRTVTVVAGETATLHLAR